MEAEAAVEHQALVGVVAVEHQALVEVVAVEPVRLVTLTLEAVEEEAEVGVVLGLLA